MRPYTTLAANQHGLVTRKQLLELGISARAIDHAQRTEALIGVHAGVYRIAGAPVSPKQRVMAACLASGDGAAAARRTAAHLRRFIDRSPSRIEVVVPYRRQPSPSGFTVMRSRVAFATSVIDHIPVTDPARTIIDLAGVLPASELGVVLDRALRMRSVRLGALETAVVSVRARGIANLRGLVAERVGRTLSEGELETRFFELLEQLGLPAPTRQHKIFENGVEIARLDIAYVHEKIAIEIDAYSDHSDMLAFVRDRRRNNIVAADHGFVFLHFTRADLTQPRYVRDVLLKMLAQRRR